MPKKTRFIAVDWHSVSNDAPDTPRSSAPSIVKESVNSYSRALADSPPVDQTATANGRGLNTFSVPEQISSISLPCPTTPALAEAEYLQDSFEKLPVTSHSEGRPCLHRATSEDTSMSQVSNDRLFLSPHSTPPSTTLNPAQTACMARSASSSTLPIRPAQTDRLYFRKPVQEAPVPGKVYFVPDGRHFPESIIHHQKHQIGFFRHPVMILDVEGDIVNFYAMTREPPTAIRELNMAMRLGTSSADAGSGVLRLAPGSKTMLQETWINLEQRFLIEWKNIDEWAVDVQVDHSQFDKITRRVNELEADQNRYIYKPLLRTMSTMLPGMIVMLPNHAGAATFGAPIVIIENNYPLFHYLRVKRFEDNINFNPHAKRGKGSSPRMSLAITRQFFIGHDNTPVLILEDGSPEMREESYVEVHDRPQTGRLDTCKTWCWPPVRINDTSMMILRKYMAKVAAEHHASRMAQVHQLQLQAHGMAFQHSGPMHAPPPIPPPLGYGGYYQPPPPPHWQLHGNMQQPGYHMDPPMLIPAYPPGNYMYGASNIFQHQHGSGSGCNT